MSTKTQDVIDLARRLRLPHLREAADDVLATAKAQRWDPAEALRVLLEARVEGREHSMTENRWRRAHFPAGKTFDAWDPARSSISASTQDALATLEWVRRHENLVVCCALAGLPCRFDLSGYETFDFLIASRFPIEGTINDL